MIDAWTRPRVAAHCAARLAPAERDVPTGLVSRRRRHLLPGDAPAHDGDTTRAGGPVDPTPVVLVHGTPSTLFSWTELVYGDERGEEEGGFEGLWTRGQGGQQVSGAALCRLLPCGAFLVQAGEINMKLEGVWHEDGVWDWVAKLRPLASPAAD